MASYDNFFKNKSAFFKGKNILITGGAGYVGSNLANILVPMGAKVTLLDSFINESGTNLYNIEKIKAKITLLVGDIRDSSSTDYAVKNQDLIFNIAGNASHLDSMVDPLNDYDVNVKGQLTLLESCKNHNPSVKIVFLGSRAQYGSIDHTPFKEDVLMMPKDVYGANKIAGEFLHLLYAKYFNLKATSIRMGPSFGPRCQMMHAKYGVLNYLLRLIMDGKEVTIYGDGKQLRDSIFIDDAIVALLAISSSKNSWGESYNIGSGVALSFTEQVEGIIKACGFGKFKHIPWPPDRAAIEVGDSVADISKTKQDTGWEPKTNFIDAMKKTYEYYKKNKDHYW